MAQNLRQILLSNPGSFLKNISHYYPLSIDFLERNVDVLNWDWISSNENISFQPEDYLRYRHLLNPRKFMIFNRAFLSLPDPRKRFEEYLSRLKDTLNWEVATEAFKYFDKPFEIVEQYKDYIDWNELCNTDHLPWTPAIMRKFLDKLDWETLACRNEIKWTFEWLNEFARYIDWEWFIRICDYRWDHRSVDAFQRFMPEEIAKHIRWCAEINEVPVNYNLPVTSRNEDLKPEIVTREVLEKRLKYPKHDIFHFDNRDVWTIEGIEFARTLPAFSWEKISGCNFHDTEKVLKKYEDFLIWHRTVEETEIKYVDPADRFYTIGISSNTSITWTEPLLDKYAHRIHFEVFLGRNNVLWNESILNKYLHLMTHRRFFHNKALWKDFIYPKIDEKYIELVLRGRDSIN